TCTIRLDLDNKGNAAGRTGPTVFSAGGGGLGSLECSGCGREIRGPRVTSYVSVRGAAHGNARCDVVPAAAEISRVNKSGAGRVQLGHKGVAAAFIGCPSSKGGLKGSRSRGKV